MIIKEESQDELMERERRHSKKQKIVVPIQPRNANGKFAPYASNNEEEPIVETTNTAYKMQADNKRKVPANQG